MTGVFEPKKPSKSWRIEVFGTDGSDSHHIIDNARALTEYLTILETLRDVREWHAADEAEKRGAQDGFQSLARERSS